MSLINKYYFKVKYLLLEYNNILELDNKYMIEYLNNCGDELESNLIDTNLINNNLLDNKSVLNEDNNSNNIKLLYKNLAKKFHPDKNNNDSNKFIIINEAYKNNDFLTLFIYSYENKFYNKDNINEELILYLDDEIDKKEKEMNNIKNKIHWKWVNSNDLEKEIINNYIKSQLYDC